MISVKDRSFFQQAYNLAESGEHRVRVGALAVVRGKPVAGTFNTIRNISTHAVDYTAHTNHAEESCLKLIPYESRSKATLYVCRINREGFNALSYPCFHCIKKILKAGIKELVYWDDGLVKIRPFGE